jgi:hypothetical protein
MGFDVQRAGSPPGHLACWRARLCRRGDSSLLQSRNRNRAVHAGIITFKGVSVAGCWPPIGDESRASKTACSRARLCRRVTRVSYRAATASEGVVHEQPLTFNGAEISTCIHSS